MKHLAGQDLMEAVKRAACEELKATGLLLWPGLAARLGVGSDDLRSSCKKEGVELWQLSGWARGAGWGTLTRGHVSYEGATGEAMCSPRPLPRARLHRVGSKITPIPLPEGDAMTTQLVAPFPYFGGKRRVVDLVWERFGPVASYVEPFFGSGAVLLGSPFGLARVETVNDLDGLLCNAWRAIKADPAAVAAVCDWPVSECDLTARHLRLVAAREEVTERLVADPEYYDVTLAGWWIWGACCWIGSGWCDGGGPWVVEGGCVVKGDGVGVNRKLPHLGDRGRGVNRKLPHLGDRGRGAWRPGPVDRWFGALSDRLRAVRIACGDWLRVLGPAVLLPNGVAPGAIFLDPPYSRDLHAVDYAAGGDPSGEVRAWCVEHGDDPSLRIALCGYGEEHDELEGHGWTVEAWKAHGGYGSQGQGRGRDNAAAERIWFSPHCLRPRQGSLL